MTTELLAWLLDATVATTIACVAILLLRRPMQRWLGAEIAYRLWIVLPLATLAASFSFPRSAPTGVAVTRETVASAPAAVIGRVTTSLGPVDADRWLLAIWLLGAIGLLAVLIWQQRRFVARLRLRESGDGSWRSSLADVVPAVLGVLRQRLVLPDCFETDYSREEQRLVIAHERMHQLRRDPWALATSALLRTLFWFNPIVHVAVGRFRRDVEMACDAAVLRTHPGSRRRYASALLKTQFADGPLPIGCQWHQTPPMKERIMLLKHALPTRYARLAGAILLAIVSLGTTGIAMAGHDAALVTASALAATVPAEAAPAAPAAAPALAAIADVATAPAQPALAAQPAPAATPAAPASKVHARHVRLASTASSPATAAAAATVATAPAATIMPIRTVLPTVPTPALVQAALITDGSTTAGNGGDFIVDTAYIAAVDRVAAEQGVKVIWVNPPETRKQQ